MCLCLVQTVTLQRPARPYKAILFQFKGVFKSGNASPVPPFAAYWRDLGALVSFPDMASRGGQPCGCFVLWSPFTSCQVVACAACSVASLAFAGMKSALPTPCCLCVSPSSLGSGESRYVGGWKLPFGPDALICGDLIVWSVAADAGPGSTSSPATLCCLQLCTQVRIQATFSTGGLEVGLPLYFLPH